MQTANALRKQHWQNQNTRFELKAQGLLAQIRQAQKQGIKSKPVIIGPVTYLWLGKSKDETNKLDLLDSLVKVYVQLFDELAKLGIEWIQVDEPILVTELAADWQVAFRKTYDTLAHKSIKLLLAGYFGTLQDNLSLACGLKTRYWREVNLALTNMVLTSKQLRKN